MFRSPVFWTILIFMWAIIFISLYGDKLVTKSNEFKRNIREGLERADSKPTPLPTPELTTTLGVIGRCKVTNFQVFQDLGFGGFNMGSTRMEIYRQVIYGPYFEAKPTRTLDWQMSVICPEIEPVFRKEAVVNFYNNRGLKRTNTSPLEIDPDRQIVKQLSGYFCMASEYYESGTYWVELIADGQLVAKTWFQVGGKWTR